MAKKKKEDLTSEAVLPIKLSISELAKINELIDTISGINELLSYFQMLASKILDDSTEIDTQSVAIFRFKDLKEIRQATEEMNSSTKSAMAMFPLNEKMIIMPVSTNKKNPLELAKAESAIHEKYSDTTTLHLSSSEALIMIDTMVRILNTQKAEAFLLLQKSYPGTIIIEP